MVPRPKSRPPRHVAARNRDRSHASTSNYYANIADLYRGLQQELDKIQRLKLSCITRDIQNPSPEFIAVYETIYRSLQRRLDKLNSTKVGGPVAPLTKLEIHQICGDGAAFIDTCLFPLAQSPNDQVFLLKSAADLRYICMAYGAGTIQTRLHVHVPFHNYIAACGIAMKLLNPANPNRLGLTLNFALFYHKVLGWDLHACHLAKFGFDEAVRFIETFPEYEVSEDSYLALCALKECMISWTSCP